MDSTDYKKFLKQLKKHEGERLTAYKDTLGFLTIGVGHNCEVSPVPGVNEVGDKITQEMSDMLFDNDVQEHVDELLDRLPWVEDLSAPRQAVMFNMMFNMGWRKLSTFKNTLKYVKEGNFKQASANMLMSKWANQVKYRAQELAKQMETGNFVGV